jgi:hypothetical protein
MGLMQWVLAIIAVREEMFDLVIGVATLIYELTPNG